MPTSTARQDRLPRSPKVFFNQPSASKESRILPQHCSSGHLTRYDVRGPSTRRKYGASRGMRICCAAIFCAARHRTDSQVYWGEENGKVKQPLAPSHQPLLSQKQRQEANSHHAPGRRVKRSLKIQHSALSQAAMHFARSGWFDSHPNKPNPGLPGPRFQLRRLLTMKS